MTHLRKTMLEELQRRNYSQTTITTYLRVVEDFARYFGKPPDQLGPTHLRRYQVHLLQERKLAVGTVQLAVAALRFFFVKTLRRPYSPEQLPYPAGHRGPPAAATPRCRRGIVEVWHENRS